MKNKESFGLIDRILHQEDGMASLYPARRAFLRSLSCTALLAAMPALARAHGVVGTVRPPLAMPEMKLVRHDSQRTTLHAILQGKATALQFMFTGCSESCPLQGALFSAVQDKLEKMPADAAQLVSLSIDPLGDDARTMSAWLKRFDAGKRWIGAVPEMRDLDALRAALGEKKDSDLENHTAQVLLFDKQGLLVWRTENLPPVEVITRQLERIARA